MNKLILLACGLLISLYISAQDIKGYWQLGSFDTEIETKTKETTDLITKDLQNLLQKSIGSVILFTEDNNLIVDGDNLGQYRLEVNMLHFKTNFIEIAKISFPNEGNLTLSSNAMSNPLTLSYYWPEIENPTEEIQKIIINMHMVKLPDDYTFKNQTTETEDNIMDVEDATEGEVITMDMSVFEEEVLTEVDVEDDSMVYPTVEQMPEFVGGIAEMHQFIATNLRYPQEAASEGIQGRVGLHFIVNKDGSISDIEVTRRVDPLLDNEAIRVVKAMPKWTAGKVRGENVRVYFTLPITFRLNE